MPVQEVYSVHKSRHLLSYRCNTPQLSAVIKKTVAVYKIVLMFVPTLFQPMKVRVASLILQCREFGVTRVDKIPKHYQCGFCKTRVDENQQYKNKTNQLQ